MLHISLSQSMYGVFSFYLHLYLPENVAVIKRWVNGNQQQAPTLMSRSPIVARLTVNTLIHLCCQTGNREYTYTLMSKHTKVHLICIQLYFYDCIPGTHLGLIIFYPFSCFFCNKHVLPWPCSRTL